MSIRVIRGYDYSQLTNKQTRFKLESKRNSLENPKDPRINKIPYQLKQNYK